MSAAEQAFHWLSLLVIWISALIFGGLMVCLARHTWITFVRPRWIRRLRRIERGRREQADA
jgi:ABC-type phosphate transport system permease subunit